MNPMLATIVELLPSPVIETLDMLRKMNKRQLILQIFNFASVFLSAFMLYKGLAVLTNNPSPATVVLSQSMYPAFSRGDILFLNMSKDPITTGDITVFTLKGQAIPIVHRVVKVHENQKKEIKVLTKGDNNDVHDRGLYNRGQLWLEQQDFVGRVKFCVPYLGMVTIILNDYPMLKNVLVASMTLFAIITRE